MMAIDPVVAELSRIRLEKGRRQHPGQGDHCQNKGHSAIQCRIHIICHQILCILDNVLSLNAIILAEQMKILTEHGEGHIIKLWVIALAAGISIVTVYLSLFGPMRTAGRISPVEA